VSYEGIAKLVGGKPDWLPLKPEKGFVPDEDFLSALENSKAKILLMNSPNNPTGAAYPEKVIRRIIEIAERKNMWLLSDEVYETFLYEGNFFSPGSVYEKTITLNAFSKAFSMTGWRLGYVACPEKELIDRINIIQQQTVSCAVSFVQYGAMAAFTKEAAEAAANMAKECRKRRDYVFERLDNFSQLVKPTGAFYAFPKFDGRDDLEYAEKLLEAGVGVVPGSLFGSCGKDCVRISYGSADMENLKLAMDRMEALEGKL
jgi:aspartate aminotransferase